jgi:uracil-DNA glycosylase family 4
MTASAGGPPEPDIFLQARASARHAPLSRLAERVVACDRCPRLRAHCAEVARVKRRAFRDAAYWGRPVPGLGDPDAALLVVGLAPAAHGANRTGRMFTGDAERSWLYEELHGRGWSNRERSVEPGDGLRLTGAYVTASARCAPPGNRPTPAELANCRPFLAEEIALLVRVRVVLCLGHIAFDACLRALEDAGAPWPRPRPAFRHGAVHVARAALSGDRRARGPDTTPARLPTLVCSYHPSRQNTNTGRLTPAMWRAVFARCRALVDAG